MMIEVHSSDLSARCPASAGYRRAGLINVAVPKAMFRGLAAGRAIEIMLEEGTAVDGVPDACTRAVRESDVKVQEEGRFHNLDLKKVCSELIETLAFFPERAETAYKDYDLIGQEIPIRWIVGFLEREGEKHTVEFASHLDALYRHKETGQLKIVDWKWTKDSPNWHYSQMNLQMRSYMAAMQRGEFMMNGFYVDMADYFGERLSVEAELFWIPGLMPYKRRTTVTVEGVEQVFHKGDHRPITKILHYAQNSRVDQIEKQIMLRAEWIRTGYYPEMPTPDGCMACPAQQDVGYCTVAQDLGGE